MGPEPPVVPEQGHAHSTYGCLVAPFDLDAYAAQLRRLCQDVELRSRLSQAAQTHCLDYSPERIRSRWEEIFSQL